MDFRSQVWKRVWEMAFFGLKLGLDLEMRAAHPNQKFQGVPTPGGNWGWLILPSLGTLGTSPKKVVINSQASEELEARSKDWVSWRGKIKMVYDRLRGIESDNLPLSRQQAVDDQETEAQQNVLSSVNGKTPKEHQIGERFSQERTN